MPCAECELCYRLVPTEFLIPSNTDHDGWWLCPDCLQEEDPCSDYFTSYSYKYDTTPDDWNDWKDEHDELK